MYHLIVYTRHGCCFCDYLKKALNKLNINYIEQEASDDDPAPRTLKLNKFGQVIGTLYGFPEKDELYKFLNYEE